MVHIPSSFFAPINLKYKKSYITTNTSLLYPYAITKYICKSLTHEFSIQLQNNRYCCFVKDACPRTLKLKFARTRRTLIQSFRWKKRNSRKLAVNVPVIPKKKKNESSKIAWESSFKIMNDASNLNSLDSIIVIVKSNLRFICIYNNFTSFIASKIFPEISRYI